jgi:hypothetical protein
MVDWIDWMAGLITAYTSIYMGWLYLMYQANKRLSLALARLQEGRLIHEKEGLYTVGPGDDEEDCDC